MLGELISSQIELFFVLNKASPTSSKYPLLIVLNAFYRINTNDNNVNLQQIKCSKYDYDNSVLVR